MYDSEAFWLFFFANGDYNDKLYHDNCDNYDNTGDSDDDFDDYD